MKRPPNWAHVHFVRQWAAALRGARIVNDGGLTPFHELARRTTGPVVVAMPVEAAHWLGEALERIVDGAEAREQLGLARAATKPRKDELYMKLAVAYFTRRARGVTAEKAYAALAGEFPHQKIPSKATLDRWIRGRDGLSLNAIFEMVEKPWMSWGEDFKRMRTAKQGPDTTALRAQIARHARRGAK